MSGITFLPASSTRVTTPVINPASHVTAVLHRHPAEIDFAIHPF
jgi:hypothetical protein